MERNAKIEGRRGRLLPLPVGNSDWAHISSRCWCADKTQLISGLLERETTVALFTRPRRFGKTTEGIPVLKYGVGFCGKRVVLAK